MIEFKELSKIYYNYALSFLEKNYLCQGIEYLKRSITLNKQNIEALNLIGICEYKNCRFEKAYYFWNKSLEYNKEEHNRAKNYLKELKDKKFKQFIFYYNQGIEKFEMANYKEVIDIFQDILKINQELIEPYIIISSAYYNIKKYEKGKEFLEKAISFDKCNNEYFRLLKEIDSKNINIYKDWILKKKKIIGALGTVASLSVFSNAFNYNDKLKQGKRILSYEKNISKIKKDLSNTIKEKNILKMEVDNYKLVDDNLKNKQKGVFTYTENYRNKDEGEVFLEGISLFKNEEYDKAINAFMYISEKGEQTTLVGESIFFSAICAEKINNVFLASKYYEKYIIDFKNCNYYDDSLYNYGLIKYKLGDIEMAKKLLNKLYKEVPNSIFLNSNVKYILK